MRSCIRAALAIVAVAAAVPDASAAGPSRRFPKLDAALEHRAAVASPVRMSTVIVSLSPGSELPSDLRKYARADRLDSINALVLDLPDSQLAAMSKLAAVTHVHAETTVYASNFRTGITSGAFFVRNNLGFTGAGVTVAMVDSGVGPHDDLTTWKALDFVGTGIQDEAGHGTHVAGTLAGDGHDSNGRLAGIAPGVSLVSLKALDAGGSGRLTDVLRALNWLAKNAGAHHIRVVNLSFGTPVTESYWQDPLALATKALVDGGVVVVVAAGNEGRDDKAHKVWGAVTSPANAPWVITVGASSTMGTLTRSDDEVAGFSSRGPTRIDGAAKPDLVASGVGTVSTAAVPSTEYSKCLVAHPSCLAGGFSGDKAPYMTLTGTSMAAPVVSGTVALMLQANPKLTPNLVKAILMYTAEVYRGFRPLEQGAGFLNSLGAVRLARFYKTARKGARVPVEPIWSKQFFWGNHRITGGIMVPDANAWDRKIVWGAVKTLGDDGDNIVWGTSCGSSDCGDNIVWGTAGDGDNIVWGTSGDGDNIVWGTSADGDNIVWGTDCGGADCGGNIVWGTAGDGDNIVWGTGSDGDNIVWGTGSDGDNIVWGTADGDNIVWGTALRGRSWRKTPLLSPSLSFEWFLDPRNDGAWIMQEFGDALMVRGAKP